VKAKFPEGLESFGELKLYRVDLYDKLGAGKGSPLSEILREAGHAVDEANEITRELRPDKNLKFEVEFVWDIYRERMSDILVIRRRSSGPTCSTTRPTRSSAGAWR